MTRAIAIALILAATFGAGWSVNGWRLGQAHEQERLQASEQARESLRLMTVSRDALATDLRTSGDIHATKLQEAQNETNRLRDRVSVGDQRLRIAVRCPSAADLPGSTPSAGLGAATSAELDPSARSAYFALRDGIVRAEATLAACQDQLTLRAR